MRGYERASYIFNRLHHENERDTIFLGYGLEIVSTNTILMVMNDRLTIKHGDEYTSFINVSSIKTILWLNNITSDDVYCIDDMICYEYDNENDMCLYIITMNDDIIKI